MSEITLNLKEGFPYTPLQILWIKQLKTYPERQMTGTLGEGTPEDYHACCLGEGVLCIHRNEGTELPFKKIGNHQFFNIFNDVNGVTIISLPSASHAKKLNLYSIEGVLMNKEILPENHWALKYESLSDANDIDSKTWTQIAELIEQYPEVVFDNL